MGYIVEVSDEKVEKVSDHIEKALKYMGKAMQCVEQWMEESEGMGQRGSGGSMGSRSLGSRSAFGSRFDDDDDDDEMGLAERRRRRR